MKAGDKVKVKKEFKKMVAGMPGFSKVNLEKTMTFVSFEWPKVVVKENSKRWDVGWLETIKEEVKKSGKTKKKSAKS